VSDEKECALRLQRAQLRTGQAQ